MKKDLRSKTVGCKMTEAEHSSLQALADQNGQALSDWCRDALLSSAGAKDASTSPPSASLPLGSLLLEEILALRTIVTTILFHLGQGKAVEEPDMKALITRADDSKKRRAQELQTTYRQRPKADQ
jgi:hypothetical protein